MEFFKSPLIAIILTLIQLQTYTVAVKGTNNGLTLRFRALDGSIIRVENCEEEESLHDILKRRKDVLPLDNGDVSFLVGNDSKKADPAVSVSELELKNGSLINLRKQSNSSDKGQSGLQRHKSNSSKSPAGGVWQPFPDLAKPDYENMVRRAKARANLKSGMGFKDLSDISGSLHVIDPQKEGKIKRIYMCTESAQKFHKSCLVDKNKNGSAIEPKVSLLLGTFHKERENARKPRTSLSSTTDSDIMCEVAKVQTVYNLQGSSLNSAEAKRAIKLSKKLNLSVLGCIYSYNSQTRSSEEDIVHGEDIIKIAKLQAENMRLTKSKKFVFLAMEAQTGATEAFQLSDASVQMVYEGVLTEGVLENPKHLKSTSPVLLEGKEVFEIDGLLCLVNTGLLQYSGRLLSRYGSLGVKIKRKLRKKLLNDETSFIDNLCDFSLLLAFDKLLTDAQMTQLCELVTKKIQKRRVSMTRDLLYISIDY